MSNPICFVTLAALLFAALYAATIPTSSAVQLDVQRGTARTRGKFKGK